MLLFERTSTVLYQCAQNSDKSPVKSNKRFSSVYPYFSKNVQREKNKRLIINILTVMNIKRDNGTGIINEEASAMEVSEKELFIQSDLKIIINDENHNNKENFKLLEFDFESIFLKDNEKIIKKKSFDLLLTGIDLVLVCTIVLLSIVGFWRGLFQIILFYCEVYHLYFIYFIGSIIHVQFALARDAYENFFANKSNFVFIILKVVYTYIFGVCCIFQWAGLWYLLDEFLGYEVLYTVTSTLFGATMLVTLKVFRNILAPPYAISTDVPEYMFQFRTMFRTDLPKKLKWVPILTMRGSTAGIDDNLQGTSKAHFIFLSVLDTILTSIVIGPAVIGYWRGTWCLVDIYIFPNNVDYTIISSSVIGLGGHLVFTITQNYLRDNFHPEKHRLLYYTVSRLYTYVYGIACVNLWRGAWKALDYYTGTEVLTVTIPTVVSVVALAGMRTLRNISAAPFGLVLDICQGFFEVPTMFKLAGSGETSLYILDCFFSVFVVGSLVVFVWRGAWVLTDCFCYPDDDNLSAIGSLIIGYAIVIITFSLQTPMKRLCEKLTGFWRILVVDLYIGFSFIGTINLWRGIWNLLNLYFLPDSPAMSCWITHLGCFLFLVLINCSNSVLVRGVYIDAEEEGGKCVVFPTYYLRFFVQERRKKKIQKNQKNHTISSVLSKGEFEKSEKISKELSVNHNDVKCHVTVDLPPESGS